MKIMASIPVERVQLSPTSFTFRYEVVEVEVVRVLRYRCDRTRERYHYHADVRRPACAALGYLDYAGGDAQLTLRVNIIRSQNPRWRPPAFPDGALAVVVQ